MFFFIKKLIANAPPQTLPIVSLADDLPPPELAMTPYFFN